MSNDQILLEMRDLHVSYAVGKLRLHALAGVSLSVNRGETVGLVGESGSGKSTLAMTAMRAVIPDQGQLIFDGVDYSRLNAKGLTPVRRRLQMVFQNPYASLNPRMKICDIIAEPLTACDWGSAKEISDRVAALIKATGLPEEAADRLPVQFSGGQRQRIVIARALALEPDMLIADEPVSALDVSVQAQIINLLGDIQKELGIAYLVIAHDLALVHQISDRIIVMYLGEIVEQGTADDIIGHPAHPYTVSLLAATPVPDARTRRDKFVLKGDPPSAIDRPKGCPFHPRCPIARDRCSLEKPSLTNHAGRGMVACHFPGEQLSPVKPGE